MVFGVSKNCPPSCPPQPDTNTNVSVEEGQNVGLEEG